MTEITGHLVHANGQPAEGHAVVSWPAFTLYGNPITGGHQAFEIFGGDLDLSLFPNAPAQPRGTYYTVRFELQSGAAYEEYWIVPDTPAVTVEQIRVSFPVSPGVAISPSQLTGAGAAPGMILTWNGQQWLGQLVSTENIDPNYLQFEIDGTGTDFTVTGSPTVLGGTAVFHLPSASETARGLVTPAAQTFGGDKTFAANLGVGVEPSHRLDVSGNINVTGSYLVNGVPISIGGGHIIQDEGTPLTARSALNFAGAGVAVTDDPGNSRNVVTIAGQTPWIQDINAQNFALLNVGNISHTVNAEWHLYSEQAQPIVFFTTGIPRMWILPEGNVGINTGSTHGSRLGIIPADNPTDPIFTGPHIRLGETTNNPDYGTLIGFMIASGVWCGSVQTIAGGLGAPLLLNPSGGRVGMGVPVSPGGALQINNDVGGGRTLYLNQPNGSWSTVGLFNAYRYIETASGAVDGLFKAFHVGGGGVGIGYAPPTYGSTDALIVNGTVAIGMAAGTGQTLCVAGSISCTDIFLENTAGTPGITFRLDGFADWMHYWSDGNGGHRFVTNANVRMEINNDVMDCRVWIQARNILSFMNNGGSNQYAIGPVFDLNTMDAVWSNNNFGTSTRLGYWHAAGLTILGSFTASGAAQTGNLGILGGAYALDDGGESGSLRIIQQAGAVYLQCNKSTVAASRRGRINLGVIHTTNMYASDTDAGTAGLTRGDVFASADGLLRIKLA